MRLFLLIPGNLLALALAYLGWQTLPTNRLGWILLLLGLGYVVGGAVFFGPRNAPLIAKADRAVRDEPGDRSFWWAVPGFVAVFFASPLEYLFLGGAVRTGLLVQAAGLGLVVLGLALRAWTRLTLRGQYTGHLQVLEDAPLHTDGPYRYLRHPGYAGFLLMGLGIGVGFGSFLGSAAVFGLLLPGLVNRMRVEEGLLIEQHGDAYRQYTARTKRLIPGVW